MELDGLLWFAVFVFSASAHEAAHAWAALRGGDPTAYLGGQVTLNPIPHMRREPVGMLLVPLVLALSSGYCIGWASTPYDPAWEQRHPRRAAWMAAAGPAANLAIAMLAFVALRVGLDSGAFVAPDSIARLSDLAAGATPGVELLARLLSILLMLNVILFVFNLIPVPPLDGATAITVFLSDDLALRLRALLHTPALSLGLFSLVFFGFGPLVTGPVFGFVIGLLYPGMYG